MARISRKTKGLSETLFEQVKLPKGWEIKEHIIPDYPIPIYQWQLLKNGIQVGQIEETKTTIQVSVRTQEQASELLEYVSTLEKITGLEGHIEWG